MSPQKENQKYPPPLIMAAQAAVIIGGVGLLGYGLMKSSSKCCGKPYCGRDSACATCKSKSAADHEAKAETERKMKALMVSRPFMFQSVNEMNPFLYGHKRINSYDSPPLVALESSGYQIPRYVVGQKSLTPLITKKLKYFHSRGRSRTMRMMKPISPAM